MLKKIYNLLPKTEIRITPNYTTKYLCKSSKEAIPFAQVVTSILNIIFDVTKKEPSLEECMLIVSQLAYIKSFQEIVEKDSGWVYTINQDRPVNDSLALQIRDLGEQEFNEQEVKRAIVCFHDSKLAEAFNRILQQRLQHTQLTEREAKTLTEQVASHTDECMPGAFAEVGEKVDKLWRWYSAGGKEKLEKNLNIED